MVETSHTHTQLLLRTDTAPVRASSPHAAGPDTASRPRHRYRGFRPPWMAHSLAPGPMYFTTDFVLVGDLRRPTVSRWPVDCFNSPLVGCHCRPSPLVSGDHERQESEREQPGTLSDSHLFSRDSPVPPQCAANLPQLSYLHFGANRLASTTRRHSLVTTHSHTQPSLSIRKRTNSPASFCNLPLEPHTTAESQEDAGWTQMVALINRAPLDHRTDHTAHPCGGGPAKSLTVERWTLQSLRNRVTGLAQASCTLSKQAAKRPRTSQTEFTLAICSHNLHIWVHYLITYYPIIHYRVSTAASIQGPDALFDLAQ